MPYPLRTGTTELQDPAGQFCGFCRDQSIEGTGCFDGDPDLFPGPPGFQNCPDSAVIPDCQPQTFHAGSGGSIDGCGTPIPCGADAECFAPYETCEQRSAGAFGQSAGRFATITGSAAGNFKDRTPHAVSLSGLFCTGATFSDADANAGLPGPGAVDIPGTFRLLPAPSTTTTTTPATTTTTTT
jgi:hypothetical protein